MFNVGGGELAVILLLALVFLGPERLPQAARQFGKFMAEYRRMATGFKSELRDAMDLPDGTMGDLKQMVDTVRNPLDAITRPSSSTPTVTAPTPATASPAAAATPDSGPSAAPTSPGGVEDAPAGEPGEPGEPAPPAEPGRDVRAVGRPELQGPEQSFS